jgi:hypothetical protein
MRVKRAPASSRSPFTKAMENRDGTDEPWKETVTVEPLIAYVQDSVSVVSEPALPLMIV